MQQSIDLTIAVCSPRSGVGGVRGGAPPGPRGNGATKGAREPRPAPEEDEEIKEFGTEKLGVVDSLTALPRGGAGGVGGGPPPRPLRHN